MHDGYLHPDFIIGQTLENEGNFERARLAYLKGAEQGSGWCAHNLSDMLRHGRGGPEDEAQAAIWLRQAAEQGIAASQVNLGQQYAEGRGVIKDYSQAIQWFRKAAEQNFDCGQYKLGVMYINGWGVPHDEAEGYKWIRLAAEQKHTDAMCALAESEKLRFLQEASKHGARVVITSKTGGMRVIEPESGSSSGTARSAIAGA